MKELAEYLISERKKRNVPLSTIARKSGVSQDMLLCFEACDFECLGASLLIRGTVRGYCKALDIDSEPLLEKYCIQIEDLRFQEQGLLKYAKQMKLFRQKRKMVAFPLLVFALATAAIMYGGAWISEKRARLHAPPALDRISTQEELPAELRQKLSRSESNEQVASVAGKSVLIPSEAGEAGPDSRETAKVFREADKAIMAADRNINAAERDKEADRAVAAEKTYGERSVPEEASRIVIAAEDGGPEPGLPPRAAVSNSMEAVAGDRPVSAQSSKVYRFTVEADHKTWVKVVLDDKETRSAMLHAGEKREWTAKKGVQVVIGNAGGVHMKWDDQQVNAPREPGRVLRFRLPEHLADLDG
ncbi:MAG: RodZ domain-containing protein [Syntrophobacteraceae bacterium]